MKGDSTKKNPIHDTDWNSTSGDRIMIQLFSKKKRIMIQNSSDGEGAQRGQERSQGKSPSEMTPRDTVMLKPPDPTAGALTRREYLRCSRHSPESSTPVFFFLFESIHPWATGRRRALFPPLRGPRRRPSDRKHPSRSSPRLPRYGGAAGKGRRRPMPIQG